MINTFSRFLFSFTTGIISGFFALIFLGFIQIFLASFGTEYLIPKFFINEVGEELIKILFIIFVLNLLISNKKDWSLKIFHSVLVGIGFGFFEIILIALSGGLSETIGLILILGIHGFTSFFLGMALFYWQAERKFLIFTIFLAIAVGIHIGYNLFALNFYK